eukprot:sb/3473013/
MSSVSSEPPPPPAPVPLLMMMGPGGEDESDEEQTERNVVEEAVVEDPPSPNFQPNKKDFQDVRDYVEECHNWIIEHNKILDRKAKSLERDLRNAMDAQDYDLEQKLLREWLRFIHEKNTMVRKQDQLNSFTKEKDVEERCYNVTRRLRKLQNMRGNY